MPIPRGSEENVSKHLPKGSEEDINYNLPKAILS
jgi:hypothetical protein